jgi:hypothetical protein
MHFAFEPAAGEGQMGDGGRLRGVRVDADVEFDAGVRWAGHEEVDHPHGPAAGGVGGVVLGGDQGAAVAVVEQAFSPGRQVGGIDIDERPAGGQGVHGSVPSDDGGGGQQAG